LKRIVNMIDLELGIAMKGIRLVEILRMIDDTNRMIIIVIDKPRRLRTSRMIQVPMIAGISRR
jgi:hypothetical protein